MNILLIHNPDNTSGYTWERLLNSAGHTVRLIESWSSADKLPGDIDLCLPLPGTNDYVNRSNGRLYAVQLAEQAGIPLVNSYQSIVLSSDKFLSFRQWQKVGLLQPKTYRLDELTELPDDIASPFIVKPAVGHSGENVSLMSNFEQVKDKNKSKDYLIQEYISKPICLRVIASNSEVLSVYERRLPGAIAVNVARGATRHPIVPSADVQAFACKMIESLGGGLMGVDILEKDGTLYALEANVPFGFDKHDKELSQKLIAHIESYR